MMTIMAMTIITAGDVIMTLTMTIMMMMMMVRCGQLLMWQVLYKQLQASLHERSA
jgi:hypothetical protein